MKYIQVPEDIQVGQDSSPWKFIIYLEKIVLDDPAMGVGFRVIEAQINILKQFEGASPGAWVFIDDAHHELIKNVVENPKGEGVPRLQELLRKLFPFMEAIMNASNAKPKDK